VLTKEDDKRLCLILERQKGQTIGTTKQAPNERRQEKKTLVFQLSVKEKKIMKGYILPLRGTQYDWHDQNKVLIIQGKKREVLALSSTNVNEK